MEFASVVSILFAVVSHHYDMLGITVPCAIRGSYVDMDITTLLGE